MIWEICSRSCNRRLRASRFNSNLYNEKDHTTNVGNLIRSFYYLLTYFVFLALGPFTSSRSDTFASMLRYRCRNQLYVPYAVLLHQLEVSASTLWSGFATHFGETPLWSMRAVLQVTFQRWRHIDADAWCKRALTVSHVFVVNYYTKIFFVRLLLSTVSHFPPLDFHLQLLCSKRYFWIH